MDNVCKKIYCSTARQMREIKVLNMNAALTFTVIDHWNTYLSQHNLHQIIHQIKICNLWHILHAQDHIVGLMLVEWMWDDIIWFCCTLMIT